MTLIKFMRQIQQVHEAIPLPGAIIYNAIPAKILREPEKRIAQAIVQRIDSGTMVDLGSGTGYLSIEIAKMAPGLKVYGIDLSKAMINIATRHAQAAEVKNIQFEFCNAADLPFEDDSVDFIVSTGALHHFKRPIRVFDECYRVLKNGKEAWIYDGCPDIPGEALGKLARKYGFFRSRLLRRLQTIHGFRKEEYDTIIRDALKQTKFKDSYKMEHTDIWMKITARKME
ncbi:MAG: methyltransferase domain-containing protein [Dehalococcoidia bacterium]|nr:MAG: methyltransferase domain-containing protein [Dehalococcoidia bacterium]